MLVTEIARARFRAQTPGMQRIRRMPFLLLAFVLALAVAAPALSADPSPSVPPGRQGEKPGPPDHARAKAKAPKVEVTLTGTLARTTDDRGRPTYTLSAGGRTYELGAGPKWHWGDNNPLNAYVGTSVTVMGWLREGTTDVSVDTVDGTAIRAAGKPPWAGGPWVVGEGHPGWKDWMKDGKPGHGRGREHAPGQLKDRTGEDDAD